MEESINNSIFEPSNAEGMLEFDNLRGESSYIKVIGVGGGGGNAVNHMYKTGIQGVDFYVTNTDYQALQVSSVPNKIELGRLGAGGRPPKGRKAALAHKDEILKALSNNTKMLFITAGMGGGTGTGAAPVVAEVAKSIDLIDEDDDEVQKILVVAVVTMPFEFEGARKRQLALEGIEELRKHVDSILIINNDKLREKGNLVVSEAFAQADNVLLDAVKGIAEIITRHAYINVDFNDVNTVMQHSGTALMGTGTGKGENRAMDAVRQAITSELLNDNNIKGAKNALLYFSYSSEHEIRMDEITQVTKFLTDEIGGTQADIIWGNGVDDSLGEELKITLIATGYNQKDAIHVNPDDERHVIPFDEKPADETKPTEEIRQPADENGMFVITKPSQPEAEVKQEQPEAKVEEKPQDKVEVKPQEEKPARKVHKLELEEEKPAVAESPVQHPEDDLAGLQLRVHNQQEQVKPVEQVAAEVLSDLAVAEPVLDPQPVQQPSAATVYAHEDQPDPYFQPRNRGGNQDNEVNNRADRIRLIHELLRNDPEGPSKVENIGRNDRYDIAFSMSRTSSMRENVTTLDADGNMKQNTVFPFEVPD